MIIALSGRMGSGKDTAADMILSYEYGYEIKRFSGKLKQVAELLTGIPAEAFNSQEVKLQKLGPEWSRWVITYNDKYGSYTDYFSTEAEADREINRLGEEGGYYIYDKWLEEMTIRDLLQKLGTDAVRNGLHHNAWVNALFADYEQGMNWVITDCRFPNEYEAVKKRGGIVVRIERGERKQDVHSSESALDNADFDYVIDNNGTLEDLKKKVDFLLFKIGY